MNDRLTFLTPINFSVPYGVYSTLIDDCYHFGYKKRNGANLNGFLNVLIPMLSKHRYNIHKGLLERNGGDEYLTTVIEENIYNYYINSNDFCDDGYCDIHLRINRAHYEEFLSILDVESTKYGMDFTNYIRSLLLEYVSKPLIQREYFFYYDTINKIKNAISQKYFCWFYFDNESIKLVPFLLEEGIFGYNLIVGLNVKNNEVKIVELRRLKNLIVDDEQFDYGDDEEEYVRSKLYEYYDKITESDE